MKRGRWILVTVLLVAMCGSVGVVGFREEREPEYEGKKLSEWLNYGSSPSYVPDWEYRGRAVRQIGTNAVPFLLRWIRYETPRWKRVVCDVGERLHVPWLSRVEARETARAESAVVGFQILGPDARGAIPELVVLARSGAGRERTPMRAGEALGWIGADGVPALLTILTNWPAEQGSGLVAVMCGWAKLGTNRGLGVPVLVQELQSTNQRVVAISAQLLGHSRVLPEVVVPALSNAFQSSDEWVRFCALRGLHEFGEGARAATPLFVRALGDSDRTVRLEATDVLMEIAPEMLQTNR